MSLRINHVSICQNFISFNYVVLQYKPILVSQLKRIKQWKPLRTLLFVIFLRFLGETARARNAAKGTKGGGGVFAEAGFQNPSRRSRPGNNYKLVKLRVSVDFHLALPRIHQIQDVQEALALLQLSQVKRIQVHQENRIPE